MTTQDVDHLLFEIEVASSGVELAEKADEILQRSAKPVEVPTLSSRYTLNKLLSSPGSGAVSKNAILCGGTDGSKPSLPPVVDAASHPDA
jgi:hypothetical protein